MARVGAGGSIHGIQRQGGHQWQGTQVCLGMDARVAENPQGRKGTEKGPATPPHMRVRVLWRCPVWSGEVPAVTGSPEPQKQPE